jgi:tRNA G37 N-methylase Trm5
VAEKEAADRIFLNNMNRQIEASSKWLRWLRKRRALKYYFAVKWFGSTAFWDKK